MYEVSLADRMVHRYNPCTLAREGEKHMGEIIFFFSSFYCFGFRHSFFCGCMYPHENKILYVQKENEIFWGAVGGKGRQEARKEKKKKRLWRRMNMTRDVFFFGWYRSN